MSTTHVTSYKFLDVTTQVIAQRTSWEDRNRCGPVWGRLSRRGDRVTMDLAHEIVEHPLSRLPTGSSSILRVAMH